jgi:hypothetical protein
MRNREEIIERIRNQFVSLTSVLNERSRMQWAATEAEKYGFSGCVKQPQCLIIPYITEYERDTETKADTPTGTAGADPYPAEGQEKTAGREAQ